MSTDNTGYTLDDLPDRYQTPMALMDMSVGSIARSSGMHVLSFVFMPLSAGPQGMCVASNYHGCDCAKCVRRIEVVKKAVREALEQLDAAVAQEHANGRH